MEQASTLATGPVFEVRFFHHCSRRASDRLVSRLSPSGQAGPAEMATLYCSDTRVLNWREGLVCSQCGSRKPIWS